MSSRESYVDWNVVRSWPRLPRGAVAAPSLAGFKARLDGAWSTLLWWKGALPRAGGWNEMVCKVPSNPNRSVILWTRAMSCLWTRTLKSCAVAAMLPPGPTPARVSISSLILLHGVMSKCSMNSTGFTENINFFLCNNALCITKERKWTPWTAPTTMEKQHRTWTDRPFP